MNDKRVVCAICGEVVLERKQAKFRAANKHNDDGEYNIHYPRPHINPNSNEACHGVRVECQVAK